MASAWLRAYRLGRGAAALAAGAGGILGRGDTGVCAGVRALVIPFETVDAV